MYASKLLIKLQKIEKLMKKAEMLVDMECPGPNTPNRGFLHLLNLCRFMVKAPTEGIEYFITQLVRRN